MTFEETYENIVKQQEQMQKSLIYISRDINKLASENEDLKAKNKQLKEEIEELKQDKDNLMKIAMKTPDSIAFPKMAHHIYFALIEVLKDNSLSDEEKLTNLKTYLKPSLDKDTHQALHFIEEFKQEHVSFENIINELVSWIKFAYKLN